MSERHTARELPPREPEGCNCYGCRMIGVFREISELMPYYKPLLNNIFENWEAASGDAQYYREIVEGHWPGSVAILEHALARAIAKATGQVTNGETP